MRKKQDQSERKLLRSSDNKSRFPLLSGFLPQQHRSRTILNSVILAIGFPLIAGCASKALRLNGSNAGEWTAKILIRDAKEGGSHMVVSEIKAIRPNHLRMDVTTTLGIHLFSLVMKEQDLRYMLVREKKFFQGAPTARAFAPILKMNLDPKILFAVLFDQRPEVEGFECEMDGSGIPQNCFNAKEKIKVTWKDRDAYQKIIQIQHPSASLQMSLKLVRAKVEGESEIFTLSPPAGFAQLKLKSAKAKLSSPRSKLIQ